MEQQPDIARALSRQLGDAVERAGASLVMVSGRARQPASGLIFADGRVFDAAVAARDSALDLALLTIRAGGLQPIARGDSARARVGELVFAIGHPWGQPGVVTAGIISGLGALPLAGVPGRGGRTAHYIRTDVRLAPGNSGGPLLDAAGGAIGVNAMIFGGDLAVAIPIHVASAWLDSAAGGAAGPVSRF